MADAIFLPGTEMEVFEKTPGSDPPARRLDHPDLTNVLKTTFAKGVIKDFKLPEHVPPQERIAVSEGTYVDLEGDPFLVESMVKVEVDGEESDDFIPIFYQPKKEMWDDPPVDKSGVPSLPEYGQSEPEGGEVKATDFDEETGAYKKAWQSFRCGDEVVVMLQEGKPVAVIGFADGVPRIGEDVFSLETTGAAVGGYWGTGYSFESPYKISVSRAQRTVATYHWRTFNPTFFPDGIDWVLPEKAPDNLDYKLLQLAEKVEGGVVTLYNSLDEPFPRWQEVTYFPWDPPESIYPSGKLHFRTIEDTYYCKVSVWIVIVGPIVYAIYGASQAIDSKYTYYIAHYDRDGDTGNIPIQLGPYTPDIVNEVNPVVEEFTQWCWPPGGGGWGEPEWNKWYEFWLVHRNARGAPVGQPTWNYELDPLKPENPEHEPPDIDRLHFFMVKAGLYTPELVEAIKASINSIDPVLANGHGPEGDWSFDWGGGYSPIGWQPPIDFAPNVPEELVLQRGLTWFLNNDYRSGSLGNPDMGPISNYECPANIDFYYRPHTKEELQAADMWPKKE
jgi:hypothetical protein